jgi:hypothetical protein
MSLRRITAGFSAVLFLPCLAFASEPAAETLLARHLLEVPELKETILASLAREVPAGTGAELAMGITRGDERVWKALEEELSSSLGTRMSRERIQELARSYGENPQQAWGANGAEMVALAVDLSKVDNRFSRAVMRNACSAGILAPNIDRAKEKAGKSGPFKATPQAMEALQPILQRLDETCDCVIGRELEAFGAKLIAGQVPQNEIKDLTQKIFESGQCPDPFEGLAF